MNTEKIEKLKKGLTNSQIPETLREKIRQQISRLEAEDKANEAPKEEAPKEEAPKAEATPKKEPAPKKARAPRVAKAPTVRKPREKKVVEPKTPIAGKKTAMALAKEIRKDGEKWGDAVKRASSQMKKGTKEIKKSTNTELKKLLALVKKRKELKGISGTNLKRDSTRKAKPRGSRTVTHSGETTNQYGTYDNKLGRKYSENRDNRTDRLSPKYPKNSPYLELGGGVDATMTYDLAGFTSGGTGGLNAGMPLSDVSGTNYTGLVGETGAMSAGEMFAGGGGIGKVEHYPLDKNKLDESAKWYANRIKSGSMTTTKKSLIEDIERNKEDLFLLEIGRKKPANIIGTGYRGNTRKLANTYLLEQIYEKNKILELLGESSFENGGGLPSGAMQSYVNNYLGEGTAQGIYKNGGGVESVPRIEYIEFVDYVNEFYGKNGIYADQLNGGFTKSQIKVAVVKYFSTFNKNRTWGGGNSLDRERVREILDPSYKMEHGGKMHDYEKMEDNYARGGGIRTVNGREYPTGRNWTNDHRQHNKAQDYEVPKNNRK